MSPRDTSVTHSVFSGHKRTTYAICCAEHKRIIMKVKVYVLVSCGLGSVVAFSLFYQMYYTGNQHVKQFRQDSRTPKPPPDLQNSEMFSTSDIKLENISSLNFNVSNILPEILVVAKYLKKSRIHSRGSKTQRALDHASEHMDAILRDFGTSFEEVTKRKVYESRNMCPEYYLHGYKIKECSHAKPLEQIVTFVRLEHGSHTGTQFFKDGYGENIHMIVGDYSGRVKESSNVLVRPMEAEITEGAALNILTKQVKTEYTLILRDVTALDLNARIERLVREIEILNVRAVGGAIRNSDNVWRLGCHQRAFRNYTVVYNEGYDESMHDCQFCDHVDGPFLIKTTLLNQIQFDSDLTTMGLYEDFFMRLNGEVALCPDALYDMDFPHRSAETADWEKFGRKRNLYRLKFSFGLTINFGCNYDYPCERRKGFIRSPCCIQELADLSYDYMNMCEQVTASCQLNCGTILGAVKMYTVIPWEADADLNFWCHDYTKLKTAGLKLDSKTIVRTYGERNSSCVPGAAPAILGVISKHWRADVWSRSTMESYEVRAKNRNITRIPHNGHLLNGMRNPALFARNMYSNIFIHNQHHSEIGFENIYKFTKCPIINGHDCLDNYYEDGNIQFGDPVP